MLPRKLDNLVEIQQFLKADKQTTKATIVDGMPRHGKETWEEKVHQLTILAWDQMPMPFAR